MNFRAEPSRAEPTRAEPTHHITRTNFPCHTFPRQPRPRRARPRHASPRQPITRTNFMPRRAEPALANPGLTATALHCTTQHKNRFLDRPHRAIPCQALPRRAIIAHHIPSQDTLSGHALSHLSSPRLATTSLHITTQELLSRPAVPCPAAPRLLRPCLDNPSQDSFSKTAHNRPTHPKPTHHCTMKIATVKLKGSSPYSQSRYHAIKRDDKEGYDAFEKRIFRERLHYDEKGMVFIPPMAFKNCLSSAAKYLKKKIPGSGAATYTKKFEAGIMVVAPMPLGIHKDDVPYIDLFLPADGIRGSGKRVEKRFPVINDWSGEVIFHILEDQIPKDIFEEHLSEAGKFIGIGFFRPEKNGYWGRFGVEAIKWKD